MINDTDLLTTITESADMGRASLSQVLSKTNDEKFRQVIKSQIKEYDQNYKTARELLQAYGEDTKKASNVAKAQSQVMVNMKTLMAEDKASKIAEMVMQGSTMGVTTMTKSLHNYTGNNDEIKQLAEKHIKTEEANIQQMKSFL